MVIMVLDFCLQKIIQANESRENKPDNLFLVVLNLAVKYRGSSNQVHAMPMSVNVSLFRQKWDFRDIHGFSCY